MPTQAAIYNSILEQCRQHHAALVVVSKMRSNAAVMGIYHLGHRLFAENRVQDLLEKADVLPLDIEWHLIGHLQTNKVKDILPAVTCIHSLDSGKLWKKINDEGQALGKVTDCLLQIKIAQEETKYGWHIDQLNAFLTGHEYASFPYVNIRGVMGMASLTDDKALVRSEMHELFTHFQALKATFFSNKRDFDTISMGMSGDYEIALEEGSNMVRIGSLLFQ